MVRRILQTFCWTILLHSCLFAQDFHYSQFTYAPLHLSPGLTGVFAGDTRITTNYRSQWNQVPVAYRTFTVTADHKYTCGNDKPGFLSSGIALNYDYAGDSRLARADIGLYGSYTRPLNEHSFLTGGLNVGVGQRRFRTDDLRFDQQFDSGLGVFNPDLSSGEVYGNQSHLFMDFSLGVNFRWQALDRGSIYDFLEKRSKIDVGIGIHHLNQADMSFIEDTKVTLPMRFSPYADGTIQIGDPLDIHLTVLGQFQGTYRQYLGTIGAKLHLDRTPGDQLSVKLGFGYRFDEFGDAWYPALEFNYHEILRASLSYDINISDFTIATNRRGGLELNLRYLIKKVCPLPNFKFCPLI